MTDATHNVPISRHPAFKWGVGVWFALLMGLGLFVMPAAIHQSLAERLAIDGLLTGTAVRMALSLAAALLGFLIGIVLAMRVTAISDAVSEDDDDGYADIDKVWLPEDEEEDVPPPAARNSPRRPFNPREDMEEEGITAVEANAVKSGTIANRPFSHPTGPLEAQNDGAAEQDESVPVARQLPPQTHRDHSDAPASLPQEQQEEMEGDPSFILAGKDAITGTMPTEQERAQPGTAQPSSTNRPFTTEALGDLSLDALTARLENALKAHRAEPVASPQDTNPVVAFLRREAERGTQRPRPQESATNPQADLRSALDRLNRVSGQK